MIGAGPAGLAATLNLARAHRSVALLDANRPRHAATLVSHGFITRDGTPPLELRSMGREEVLQYSTVHYEKTIVHSITPVGDKFMVIAKRQGSAEQSEIRASAVLLATGLTETLPVAQMVRPWYGTSLHSCMDCDGFDKRGQKLVLIGEMHDLAMRALVVSRHTDDLLVCTNGSDVLSESDEAMLRERGIKIARGKIEAIEGDRGGMQAVVVDGERFERTAGFVRPEWHAPLGYAEGLELELDEHGLVIVDTKQRTSRQGVFAAGDITPGFRQIAVAAGEGTIAASVINRMLIEREVMGTHRSSPLTA
ncbi:NAD(P)/FAD-dependent oxidoreductase [Humidisolicoccus flavus]|uniref:NAD(P)/FAD-dependent oxidoreductase n=1 Tax=Humidisolicoccus flavus TaxID=3111414 RepID=UPI003250FB32